MKVDYKKEFKNLYLPKEKPSIIDIPSIKFAVIEGEGNPNSDEFSLRVEALYGFSYKVKMSYKSKNPPEGFYDYVVFPLEGVWDLIDTSKSNKDKNNYKYSIMIRQPEFLTNELFKRFIEELKSKKNNPYIDDLKFQSYKEGLCCQTLHLGSYDNEPLTFKLMDEFCKENGYERISKKHREIYLSDPRRTKPEKLKTVLRYKVALT